MHFILDALRGAMIGIANVIPGVSGGTMAVVMGIYDKILFAATNILKDFKKSFRTLLPYGVGLLVGILAFARVLEFLFDRFPVPTAFAFCGLILGALPMLTRKIRGKNVTVPSVLACVLMVLLVVVLPLLKAGAAHELTASLPHVLLLVLLGVIASATMVVPGVSGSMVLMLMGYYESVLGLINQFTRSALALDFAAAGQSALLLIPFLIGAVIGIVGAAKGIRYLLEHHTHATYWGIVGLVVASPFAVLYGNDFATLSVGGWIICLLVLACGLVVSLLLGGDE